MPSLPWAPLGPVPAPQEPGPGHGGQRPVRHRPLKSIMSYRGGGVLNKDGRRATDPSRELHNGHVQAARTRGHCLEQGWWAAQSPCPSSGACSHKAVVRPLGNGLHMEAPKTEQPLPGGHCLSSLGEVTSLRTALQGARAHPLQRCKHRGLQRTACPHPSVVAGMSCPGATQEGKSRRACHGDRTQEAGRGTPALPPHPGGSPPGPCLAPHAPGAPAVSVS